jgi:Cdc6-like AAA superfamily ATPase
MDIKTYLRRQQEQFGRSAQHVKDFSVFDFSYMPDEPLMRDECTRLIDALLRFDISRIPTHQVVIGSRGSGKTLTLKYLQRIIPTHTGLRILYANCREENTSFKIFAHLLEGEVAGASLSELYQRFVLTHPPKTVVILDEVDLMSPKDPRREILYLLSRSTKPFMVIMLSNSPHVIKQLDAATRSSLQPEPVHFRNYNAEQIHEILRDRAQRGLRQWADGQLAEIAALTVRQTNADARVAIKTLWYLACGVTGDIPTCFEQARRDVVVDVVNDLSDHNLLILWAAAQHIRPRCHHMGYTRRSAVRTISQNHVARLQRNAPKRLATMHVGQLGKLTLQIGEVQRIVQTPLAAGRAALGYRARIHRQETPLRRRRQAAVFAPQLLGHPAQPVLRRFQPPEHRRRSHAAPTGLQRARRGLGQRAAARQMQQQKPQQHARIRHVPRAAQRPERPRLLLPAARQQSSNNGPTVQHLPWRLAGIHAPKYTLPTAEGHSYLNAYGVMGCGGRGGWR